MKKQLRCIIHLFFILPAAFLFAQEEHVDRLSVAFSDPGKPGILEADLMNGGITVTGYDGDEVIIEAKTRMKKISNREDENNEKVKGMFRIPVVSSELSVEEHNNRMEIDVESHKHTIDLNIRTPRNTSLILETLHNGDISVDNITGELEIDVLHGQVSLTNISGSVIANSFHKDLTVVFNQITPDKAMSFSTFHGDVDVTFPASLNATVRIKTEHGAVYSDFEIQKTEDLKRIVEEDRRGEDGAYHATIENVFTGKISNGGPEFQFTTYHGNILIRKQ